jgi:hypothetical protein
MALDAETPVRARGFILVLIVDADQAAGAEGALARVSRDYDTPSIAALQAEVMSAAKHACNQLTLADRLRLLARRAPRP